MAINFEPLNFDFLRTYSPIKQHGKANCHTLTAKKYHDEQ